VFSSSLSFYPFDNFTVFKKEEKSIFVPDFICNVLNFLTLILTSLLLVLQWWIGSDTFGLPPLISDILFFTLFI